MTHLVTIALAFVALSWQGSTSQPASAPAVFRVVTWNVHGCTGSLDEVVRELRRLEGDILCLQEAETPPAGSKQPDQPRVIAAGLGMHQYSAGSALPGGNEQRMAILSRAPLSTCRTLDAGTGRIYGVSAEVGGDRPCRVFSIHLTSSYRVDPRHAMRTTAARLREAAHLARHVETCGRPCIVAGDFNAVPGMPEHEHLSNVLMRVTTTRPTCPSEAPMLSIDHIYCTPEMGPAHNWTVRTLISDHLPVVADFPASFSASPPAERTKRAGGNEP